MGIHKIGFQAIKKAGKLIGFHDIGSEIALKLFIDDIKGLKGEKLLIFIRGFFDLDFFTEDEKKLCLIYLFQKGYIDNDNIEDYLLLIPEFKNYLNSIRPFLKNGKSTLIKISVGNDLRKIFFDK